MGKIATFNDQQMKAPVRVPTDNIKSYRNVIFNDGSGSVRILTLHKGKDIWVTETIEEIEALLGDN